MQGGDEATGAAVIAPADAVVVEPPPVDRPGPDRSLAIAVALVVMALVPVATVVLTRVGHTYTPAGDVALIDLRVREIWSGHLPLVGPYGNRGWSHPGPALFYLLAIPSLLSGRAAWGTQVGAALLQGVAIVWLARLAWRRGGLPLTAAAMVGISLVGHGTTAFALRDPWNPNVVLLFFALFVFQGWLLATQDTRVLPGAVAVATLLVQSHVGYAPLIIAVAAFVVACVLLDRARKQPSPPWRAPIRWAVLVGVVMWFLPLVDVVAHWPGNLWAIAKYFVRSDSPVQHVGLTHAAELMAEEFSAWAPWVRGPQTALFQFGPVGRSAAWLLVPVGVLAAGAIVARHRRDTASLRFVGLAGVLLVVGTLAITRVDGTVLEYQFLWRPVVAVAVVLGGGWALLAGSSFGGRWRHTVGLVAAALVIVWSSGMLARDVHGLSGDTARERATAALTTSAVEHGVPEGGAILRLDDSSYVQLQRGLFNELRRRGEPVYVDEALAYQFPGGAAAAPSGVERVWWVADSGTGIAALSGLDGAKEIASYSPLSASHERRARALEATLLAQLRAADRADLIQFLDSSLLAYLTRDVDGVDHRVAQELADLNGIVEAENGLRAAIFAFDPATAPAAIPTS